MRSEAHVAHHFGSVDAQRDAARLGMWIFLGTEVLLFGGLFVTYASYRYLFTETFREGSRHLNGFLGTVNTVVLVSSSLTVALSLYFIENDQRKKSFVALVLTLGMAGVFLAIKGIEYAAHFREGALPGKYYHFPELQRPGANLFYTLYFFMTGLHAIHVLAGMGVLTWLAVKIWRGSVDAQYHTPVELGALYWHLVDLIWLFLYPLLYLI